MNTIILMALGLLGGLILSIVIFRRMMRIPATRIWLSNRVNWSNNEIPEGTYQLIRHGKWVATIDEK